MNLAQRIAMVKIGCYNVLSSRERTKDMKAITTEQARKSYIPVFIGEVARCDATIEVICEDIAENGISLDTWAVLKHYISERNIFTQALED